MTTSHISIRMMRTTAPAWTHPGIVDSVYSIPNTSVTTPKTTRAMAKATTQYARDTD